MHWSLRRKEHKTRYKLGTKLGTKIGSEIQTSLSSSKLVSLPIKIKLLLTGEADKKPHSYFQSHQRL